MKNKWTTIGGLIAGIGGVLGLIGTFMQTGDFDNQQFMVSIGLVGAAIAGLKASDGGL
jgi:hypothetical protein